MSSSSSVKLVLTSLNPLVCPTQPAAQPHWGLQFPLALCTMDEIHLDPRPNLSVAQRRLWSLVLTLSAFSCALALGLWFADSHLWPGHAQCGYALLSPCVFPDVCHLAGPTPICSPLQWGWRICLPPATQMHTLCACVPLAVCLASPSYSIAHPFCTFQPWCIINLIYNNNSFLFQNNLALLATTSLIYLAELHNGFSKLKTSALFSLGISKLGSIRIKNTFFLTYFVVAPLRLQHRLGVCKVGSCHVTLTKGVFTATDMHS